MSRNESRDLRAAMYLLFDKTQTRMSSFEVVNVIQTSGQTDLAGFRRRFETFFLGETGTREFNEAVAIVYSHHSRSPEETIAVLSSMVFNNLPVCAKEEDNSAVVSDITERYLNIPIGGSSGVPGCESALLT